MNDSDVFTLAVQTKTREAGATKHAGGRLHSILRCISPHSVFTLQIVVCCHVNALNVKVSAFNNSFYITETSQIA